MNSRLFKLAILVGIALPVASYGQGLAVPVPNATTTGTTLNTLTKLNTTSGAISGVINATTDTGGAIGVCTSGCGSTGTASIAIWGISPCVFDGTATADDWVQISSTTAGNCHDTGSSTAPTSGELVGRVFTGGAGAGTYSIILNKDIYPTTAAQLGLTGHNITAPLVCADTSASGTAQSCATSPAFTPATDDCVIYTTTTTNSGTGLTTNVNALGAKSVAIPGSSGWTATLTASIVPANKPLLACYDGTNWDVQQTGTSATGGGGLPTGTTGQTIYYAAGGTTGTATSAITVGGTTAGTAQATGGVEFNANTVQDVYSPAGAAAFSGSCASTTTTSCTITGGTALDPNGGYIWAGVSDGGNDGEWIKYSAATSTTITFATSGRGYWGSTAQTHGSTVPIQLVIHALTTSTTTAPYEITLQNGAVFIIPPAATASGGTGGGTGLVVNSIAVTGGLATFSNKGGQKDGILFSSAAFSFTNDNSNSTAALGGNALQYSIATQAITSTSLAAITNAISPVLPANGTTAAAGTGGVLTSNCKIIWNQATAGTVQFGVKASAAPTALWILEQDNAGAVLGPTYTTITTATTTATSGIITPTSFGTTYASDVRLTMNPGTSNSPSVQLYALTSLGNALTIEPGTGCSSWQ